MKLYAGAVGPATTDEKAWAGVMHGITITDVGRNHRVVSMKRDTVIVVVVVVVVVVS